ncbi:uncharacterized protein J4E84_006465 [Alternaria hordeiaustralica]|uniref:uncharacterized protein n=1 Tax=Alternaria hordeiaustralica TaxID=1187925 RepID=UPI0020C49536|nr:uncharacterized protein J4E84_006465 [Alternaria hordeiaustralica]KAI4684475.1 hypothetical protein J4E84_006465 [Alternaria hordeiaustralica]
MSGLPPPSAQPANAQVTEEPAISNLRILRYNVKESAAENALQQARNTTISEFVLQKLQKLEGLSVLKKSIDKSVRRVAEHCERDELGIELAQSEVEAMEEGEERKHEVEKLEFKKKKRMFESLVDAAMHDGLQKLTGAVEEIVRNHVPNEADAHRS